MVLDSYAGVNFIPESGTMNLATWSSLRFQFNILFGLALGLSCAHSAQEPVPERLLYMDRPIEPNKGQSGADVLLCTFKSTNAGFSSFPVRNFSPGSDYSSPTAFSHKRNPVDSTEE
jgi:hypothetical protein